MSTAATANPPRIGALLWRGLLPAYVFLAVLWAASAQVPRLNVLWLGTITLMLALPMMLALWHQATVARLMALHAFQPGRGLHRWSSRRALGILWRAALAIVLSAAVLMQSVFFSPLEWRLLALAPPLHLLARHLFDVMTAAQFTQRVYGQRWSLRATQWLLALLLAASWMLANFLQAEAPALPYAERIHQMQSAWAMAPSGTVKWALDAGAWGQASIEALGRQAAEPVWRLLLALLIAPLSVFSFFALSLSGLGLPVAELRRTFGEPLTADPSPPPVGAPRAALWAAVASVIVVMLFQWLGEMDLKLLKAGSPFALTVRECERINGKFYVLGTGDALQALQNKARGVFASQQASACTALDKVEASAADGVKEYLRWYFSLGAEWFRFAALLTGNVDQLLQEEFKQQVMSRAEIGKQLPAVPSAYESQWNVLVGVRSDLADLLEKNRIGLDEHSCKVIKEVAAAPAGAPWNDTKARLLSGSGAGLITGTLAAKAATKAMSKASMKTASKVLVKAVAKKGFGKAGAAAVGATVGTMILPGLGTAAGLAIGAGVGLAVGVAIDLGALMLEEKLTGEQMKADLLSAVSESLQPYRETFECKAAGKVLAPVAK